MKIWVTGSTGQIGRALLANAPQGWQCQGISRRMLDLADHAAIARMIARERPDIIINSGAYTDVDQAEGERVQAMAVNAGAPTIMAAALRDTGGRLIQISTDYVFDGRQNRPYRPADRPNPLSIYGASKWLGECGAGRDAVIIRTSWVYDAAGGNFATTMLRKMRQGVPLRIIADQIGVPSYAPHLAQVIWALAQNAPQGIYHHCDAGKASWYEFACAIAQYAHGQGLIDRMPAITPITSAEYPTAARRPAYSLLDCTATREFLGDDAPHWRDNLRQMLARCD